MPSATFNYTGSPVKWKVPAGVEVVDVVLTGGGSGAVQGGKVTGSIRVKGVGALWIRIGQGGKARSGRLGGGDAYGGGSGGGNGATGAAGGGGGGGASVIRLNGTTGSIRAVAGGAGGTSGDSGPGGRGGGDIGEGGTKGTSGANTVGPATGGTQNQGGKGGRSSSGAAYYGRDASNTVLGAAGKGVGPAVAGVNGGGGGGGGYHAGGGGQGSDTGTAPGGGGGGGSNYVQGMFGYQSFRGGGTTGNGSLTLTWSTTNPPTPPSNVTINGSTNLDGLATKATSSVTVKGTPHDPDATRGVRLLVWVSKNDSDFRTHGTYRGTYDAVGDQDVVVLNRLEQDARYFLRIYSQDHNGHISENYKSANFYTNRHPLPPDLVQPMENAQVDALANVTFSWTHHDPDPSDPQSGWRLAYRQMATPVAPAGPWTTLTGTGSANSWVIGGGTFKGNTFYEWQVSTKDQQGRWGEWSLYRSLFVLATTTPPQLLYPIKNFGVVAGVDQLFQWKFKSPQSGARQARADIRYRVVGQSDTDWITLFGDATTPGSVGTWTIPAATFSPGVHYEWQARTTTTGSLTSDWSVSDFFWGTATPATGAGVDLIASGKPQQPLGEGRSRAFVYLRGGTRLVGELTPLQNITWGRMRDDIASNVLHITQWDRDGREFLGSLRSWKHEVVVFRDGKRVCEGPITRISSSRSQVEIEFKDVWAYPYRRIMRQGYSDSYQIVNGLQVGLSTVVERAERILLNCLAYDDPNLISYITPFHMPGDAPTSRVRDDFSSTAWEEIDDLAAKAGLDYTAAGRRMLIWDTHRPIGRLPEMRDDDFSDEPIVTEYGMNLANVWGVTNNSGLYGTAVRGLDASGRPGTEGFVEQLSSSYGESEGTGTEQTLTREAIRRAEESMAEQANRSISSRWFDYGPSPLVVRVPDNATLRPTLNIGINQLIPGVWIPLRCKNGVREVAQWQKLDSMTVEQTENGEKISVVMSPAPNAGVDPDADDALAADV